MISGLLFLVFGVAGTVFWVAMIIECATKESNRDSKLIWILIIIFTHWIGALIYYLVRRPNASRNLRFNPEPSTADGPPLGTHSTLR